jgi:hypothetical protein
MHGMSCGRQRGGRAPPCHEAVGHARSVKSRRTVTPGGEKGRAASGGARGSSPDLDSTRADGPPEAGALVETRETVGWWGMGRRSRWHFGGVKNGAEERCAARPRRPGAIFKGEALPRCCAHTDRCTSASADRGQQRRLPLALRGVAGTGHVGRRARLGAACSLVRRSDRQPAAALSPSDGRWRGDGRWQGSGPEKLAKMF